MSTGVAIKLFWAGKSKYGGFFFVFCGGTGDLKNNMIKLLRELEHMKIYIEPNIKR